MPLLPETVFDNCNCKAKTAVPVIKTVKLLNSEDKANTSHTHNIDMTISDTIDVKIKGSTYNAVFQENLKLCRKNNTKNNVTVTMEFETNNVIDKNAILVNIDGLPIGYIERGRIEEITQTFHLLDSLALRDITTYWHPPTSKRYYQAIITVTRRGKWGNLNQNYQYNQTI